MKKDIGARELTMNPLKKPTTYKPGSSEKTMGEIATLVI